jgi:transposase
MPQRSSRRLNTYVGCLHLVGHEAGGLSPWLHHELQALGLPMVLLETPHASAALKAQRNETDKNDARGLAQLFARAGTAPSEHVKSEQSHRMKWLLNCRRLLKRKPLDIENDVRQSLKVFALMDDSRVQRSSFVQRIRALVAHDPMIKAVMNCMLNA